MSNARAIRYTVAAAALCTALSAGAAHAATAVFTDMLKPNGHVRSQAQKRADGLACGLGAVIMPVLEKCMRGKGWAFDHFRPNPSERPRQGTLTSYTDTHGDANGHPRGTAALHADSRACKAGHRGEASKRFKQCLAAHGWQFMYAQRAPQRRIAAPQEGWPTWGSSSWGTSSPSSSSSLDDEARRNDQSRADTQAAMDAINASNAAVAAQQAADQIQQNNIINQTAPMQQQ